MFRSLIGRFSKTNSNKVFRAKGIFVRNLSHGHHSDLRQVVAHTPFGGDIQYMSDVHLDYRCWREMNAPRVKAVAPYLIIAGDIGRVNNGIYGEFLKNVCQDFDQVLLVPGNHDYYDADFEETNLILEGYQGIFENFEVLNNKTTSLSLNDGRELTIMGSTMWSAGPVDQNEKRLNRKIKTLEKKMADYYRIQYQGRYLTVQDTDRFLGESIKWLWENCPESDEQDPLLVVTHHAPLIKKCCHPKFIPYNRSGKIDRMKWCNYSFATDLSGLIELMRPAAWIFGHTHYRTAFQYKCPANELDDLDRTTLIASNPIGRLAGRGTTKLLGDGYVRVL